MSIVAVGLVMLLNLFLEANWYIFYFIRGGVFYKSSEQLLFVASSSKVFKVPSETYSLSVVS